MLLPVSGSYPAKLALSLVSHLQDFSFIHIQMVPYMLVPVTKLSIPEVSGSYPPKSGVVTFVSFVGLLLHSHLNGSIYVGPSNQIIYSQSIRQLSSKKWRCHFCLICRASLSFTVKRFDICWSQQPNQLYPKSHAAILQKVALSLLSHLQGFSFIHF